MKALAGRKNSPQRDFNKKVWENAKKALTNAGWFGILPKLSAAANAAAVSAKKEFETGLSISEYGVLYYTYLVALNELGDTKTFEEVQSVLDNAGLTAPEKIQNYLDGKITVKEIFMEGTGDIE